MIRAGLEGECRRNHDDFRAFLAERMEELREAQVVADREAHSYAIHVNADDVLAGFDMGGLLQLGTVGEHGIESMNLPILRQ
ncbi:hypothetical protein D3C84_1009830 [compost metagenome]